MPNVAKHLEGRLVKKVVYQPGRIGIVTSPATWDTALATASVRS